MASVEDEATITANVGGVTPFVWDIFRCLFNKSRGWTRPSLGYSLPFDFDIEVTQRLKDAVDDMIHDPRIEQGVKPTAGLSEKA